MSRIAQSRGLGSVFTLMSDAIAVAAAVRAGRQPAAYKLRRLGIDPEQFRQIGHP